MGFVDFSVLATVMGMLKFSKPQGAPVRYPPAPDGFTVYVVGDIHGRLDLLLEVQRRIDQDKARLVRGRAVEVYLGDYIDRGPDPAGVVSRLIDRAQSVYAIFLRGNHEQLLLDFLDGKDCLDGWLAVGGSATMQSYGLPLGPSSHSLAGVVIRRKLGQAIPRGHRQFYEKTGSWIRLGGYLAVHAGIRPGVPLEEQKPADLLGIRQRFLLFDGDFGFVVVHGHTRVMAPELLPNRINIDTGAYATNLLTCLKIDAHGPRVLPDDDLAARHRGAASHQARRADGVDGILGITRGTSSHELHVTQLRAVKPLHPKGRVEDPITPVRLKVICDAFQVLKGFRARRLSSRGAKPRTRHARASFAIGFLTSSTSVLFALFAYYTGSLLPQETSAVAAKPESVMTGLTTRIAQEAAGMEEGRETAWTVAERAGSREAWQRFIEMYPDGDGAAKAQQALARIDAAEARQRADHAAWAEAEKSGTTAALRWYLSIYATGDHAADAKRRLTLLEDEEEDKRAQDDVAWSAAVLGNSRVSYAAYLGAHANGRHSADARARIDQLERVEAAAAALLKNAKPVPQAAWGAPGQATERRPSPDEPFVGADVRIRR
jgi:serine/threonine protein phosphatase 1